MRRVFLSFKIEDKPYVDGIRLMKFHPSTSLEFYDESVRSPYNSVNANYIRGKIKAKIERCSRTICLLGEHTHASEWVNWELETAIANGHKILIMGRKDGPTRLRLPPVVSHMGWSLWDPSALIEFCQ